MSCWAVIPVKPPGDGKQRLAHVLGRVERTALVEAMLTRVIAAARAAPSVARIAVVGPVSLAHGDDIVRLADPGGGLNTVAAFALEHVIAQGASRVLIVHADLPQIAAEDLEALVTAPAQTIALAPDRHGTGTNAISLPLPEAAGFAFAFGTASFACHRAEAERLRLALVTITRPGLANDIDEPVDLADAQDLVNGAAASLSGRIEDTGST